MLTTDTVEILAKSPKLLFDYFHDFFFTIIDLLSIDL